MSQPSKPRYRGRKTLLGSAPIGVLVSASVVAGTAFAGPTPTPDTHPAAGQASPVVADRPAEPREVLVKYAKGTNAESRRAVRESVGAEAREFVTGDIDLVKLGEGRSTADAIAALKRNPKVAIAEPNYTYTHAAIPNDPTFGQQWHLNNATDTDIDAPEAWDASDASSAPVTVAVIDSGVDMAHPDLKNVIRTSPGETGLDASGRSKQTNGVDDDNNGFTDDWRGWDFTPEDTITGKPGDNDPSPVMTLAGTPDEHGTHVAGILAAQRGNGIGVAGVSKQARIMPIGVFSALGSTTEAKLLRAITYASLNGANVVNGSYGGPSQGQLMTDIITNSAGVTFVFAAGNSDANIDAPNRPTYPCMTPSPNVICVGSSSVANTRAYRSNYGVANVDLVAPGEGIRSTLPGGQYGNLSGTSMAAPVVAGVAATLRSQLPSLTPTQVRDRLMANTDAFGTPGASGSGRVNFLRTIQGAAPVVVTTATVSVASGRLTYAAASGGVNAVNITASGSTYTVSDARTNLTPGAGCTAVDARRVTCSNVTAVTANLGDRDDSISADVPAAVTVDGGTGVSNVYTGAGADRITTGDEADDVQAGDGANVVTTGGGGDRVTLGAGNDTFNAGAGDDVVPASAGNDILRGGPGNDVLFDGEGADQIYGEDGDDRLASGTDAASDRADGGAGNDLFYSTSGPEQFFGGAGTDMVSYAQLAVPVKVTLGGTNGNGAAGENDWIAADVEDVEGSQAADVITGSDGPNRLRGYFGDDTISGLGGDDILDEGADHLGANPGNDDLSGGTGTDRVAYLRASSASGAVTASLDGIANDGAAARGERDFIRADVEGLEGGDDSDTLIGNASINVLAGGAGNDLLRGGGASDVYSGGRLTEFLCNDVCPADGTNDAVSYSDKTVSVIASLDGVANDGVFAQNESENIPADIERIIGGPAADRLSAGTYGATLDGGGGADILLGGAKNDILMARDGVADTTIECGGGVDSVKSDPSDRPAADCEFNSTT